MSGVPRIATLVALGLGMTIAPGCDDVCSTKAPLLPGTYTLNWHQGADEMAWHADNYALQLSADRTAVVETFDRGGHRYVVTYRLKK